MFAVAAGATVAAYQGNSLFTPEADGSAVESDVYVLASGDTRAGGTAEPASEPVAAEVQWGDASTTAAVESLYDGQANNAQREIREELDRRPKIVAPAVGLLSSGYGGRWGDFHGGVDIANDIGTEIKSATNGVVVDAGAAQGFGKWIRVMGDDGTLTVYGHVSSIDVQVGQRVTAGQRIGGMGSEGFSTGSHLHFEVWLDDGKHRVDPIPWFILNQIDLGSIGPISEASENINVPGSLDTNSLRDLVYASGNADPSNAVGAPGIASSLQSAAGSAGGSDSSELASMASGQVPQAQPAGGFAAPLGAIPGRSSAPAPAPAQNVAAAGGQN
ncbi:M23 family metallopeptidase [Dietzia sp.]|uniref:M23 family metallopeptidase n=1 Tax=Dietzia sp. TaxID=1871616 RepID=UPI002FD8CF5A